jgi:light-regulated signal transduction histidine kinase (bacteriophytochrome)
MPRQRTRTPPRPIAVRTAAREREPAQLETVLGPLRHELCNAVGPISMAVELLAMRGAGTELDMIERHVRVLSLLLYDLSELTRATQVHLDLAACPLELTDVIERVLLATEAHLGEVGASITVALPPGLCVIADPGCLALALGSLLRHLAMRSSQLTVGGTRSRDTVVVHVGAAGASLPNERALGFARGLVELQGGRLVAGNDLQLTLPVATSS